MVGKFKKKSEIEKLKDNYQKLLKEAYTLSASNRKLIDGKTTESNNALNQVGLLKKNL